LENADHTTFEVAVMHSCSWSRLQPSLPSGHCLSRARLRHLRESEWVVVTDKAIPVGLAAYKHADSDVRVVHECLVDRTLADADAAAVMDALLAALELLARDDQVGCLMFLISGNVVLPAFARRGYTAMFVDSADAWLSKTLDPFACVRRQSAGPH
jgi:hypothetical protein